MNTYVYHYAGECTTDTSIVYFDGILHRQSELLTISEYRALKEDILIEEGIKVGTPLSITNLSLLSVIEGE